MSYLNIEIKARISHPELVRDWLLKHNADFRGEDNQADTYFNTVQGRLKLRQGNIENNLIYYERKDQAGPKSSDFQLVYIEDAENLKAILAKAMGIKIVVQKKREIYFISNVKFHIDEVPGLGSFVEIEASNKYADIPSEKLQEQCEFYMNELNITQEDLVSTSYSDMLLAKAGSR